MEFIKWTTAVILAVGIMTTPQALAVEREPLNFEERSYGFEAVDASVVVASTLFRFDSGLTFDYPDAVRGVYVTGHSAGGERFNYLVELIDTTDLNAMVIDIKDDYGYITYMPADDSPLKILDIGKPYIKDPQADVEETRGKRNLPDCTNCRFQG